MAELLWLGIAAAFSQALIAWRTARKPLTYGTDAGEMAKAEGLVAR